MDILNILKSKLRKNILQLYFSHTEKEYYLRQLEKILDKPVGYIRREMLKLENMGLFKSKLKGQQKYYSLNKKYPLYQEVKSIVFKTVGIQGELTQILKKIKNIELAFIFGSYAQKKEDSSSDVDLMIIGQPDENELIKPIRDLELQIDREINYHIYSKEDFNKKVQHKDSFIKNVIQKPKIFLIGNKNELSKIYSKGSIKKR